MTVIDTPDGIAFFQLLQFEGRLKIEVETGMTFRGASTLKMYNHQFKTNFKRKAAALDDVRDRIQKAKGQRRAQQILEMAQVLFSAENPPGSIYWGDANGQTRANYIAKATEKWEEIHDD